MNNPKTLSRRTLLSAAAAAASTMVVSSHASAGSIPPTAVHYQTSPKDKNHCSLCKLFIPGPTADANGTCKSVSGAINPNGWCVLFAAKT
jgi:hypothetical protein